MMIVTVLRVRGYRSISVAASNPSIYEYCDGMDGAVSAGCPLWLTQHELRPENGVSHSCSLQVWK
jgi:hypothetical protein